jgi:hypothetical protein
VLDQTGLGLLFKCLARGRGVWLDVISSPVFGLFHNEITDNFVDVVTATIENCYSIYRIGSRSYQQAQGLGAD